MPCKAHPQASSAILCAFALLIGCAMLRTESCSAADGHNHALEIFQKRMGVFIHWVAACPGRGSGLVLSNGERTASPDAFADAVDVEAVCDDIAALGFDHVVLTDFHGFGTMLHPNKASDRWRGPGYTSRRDLVGEMIAALKVRGIGLILFTHPLDGHDFTPDQQERLGWNDPTDHYRRWNDFINDVYAELARDYGKDIMGFGFDSEFAMSGNKEWAGKLDLPRLRRTILSIQPDLSLIALTGQNDTCELGMKEIWRPTWHDPWMSRTEEDYDVEDWPSYDRSVGIVQGFHWATITPPEGGRARLTGAQMYRYTVLQAGTSTEGTGVSWAASPYPDGSWEKDVREAFAAQAAMIAPIRESLRDVYASTSYPTGEGAKLSTLPHGVVATRSTDDRVEYLHVLNPPAGRTLSLPTPADGKRFTAAMLLADGQHVALVQADGEVRLTLPEGAAWHALNTVIRLQVDPATLAPRNMALRRPVLASSSSLRMKNRDNRSTRPVKWNPIRLVDGRTRASVVLHNWESVSPGNAGWSSDRLKEDRAEHVGVDLGEVCAIGDVLLYPSVDNEQAGQGYPVDFQIQLSQDGEAWTTVVTKTNCPPPSTVQGFRLEPQPTRYVRVLATRLRSNPADHGLYSFQLAELEVRAPAAKTMPVCPTNFVARAHLKSPSGAGYTSPWPAVYRAEERGSGSWQRPGVEHKIDSALKGRDIRAYWLKGDSPETADTLCLDAKAYHARLDFSDLRAAYSDAELDISLEQGGKSYRLVGCKPGAGRMLTQRSASRHCTWEAGDVMQHAEIVELLFLDAQGKRLACSGTLELVAWPESLSFNLELSPGFTFEDGFVSGVVGNGLCIIDKPFDIPHSDHLEPEQLTVECWFKYPPESMREWGWILCKNENEWIDGCYGFRADGERVEATLNIGGGRENDFTLRGYVPGRNKNAWHHLALTYDGQTMHFYLDGRLLQSKEINKRRLPGKGILRLGQRPDGTFHPFKGLYDQVRVWERPLSAEEIQAHASEPARMTSREGLPFVEDFEEKGGASSAAPVWTDATIRMSYRHGDESWSNEKRIPGTWGRTQKESLNVSGTFSAQSQAERDVSIIVSTGGKRLATWFDPAKNCLSATGTHEPGQNDEITIDVDHKAADAAGVPFMFYLDGVTDNTSLCISLSDKRDSSSVVPVQMRQDADGDRVALAMLLPVTQSQSTFSLRVYHADSMEKGIGVNR